MKNKFVIWLSIWLSIFCVACSSPSHTVLKTTGVAKPQTLPIRYNGLPGPISIETPEVRWSLAIWDNAVREGRWYAEAHRQEVERAKKKVKSSHAAMRGSNATEACIIARENGGSYGRGTNPSHFGRYQFSYSTWVANGGSPSTWGSASAAEQDRVFRSTVNAHGYSDWTPYDGC